MDRSSTSLLGEAKTLLLATDGSPFSEGALQEAFFFGQACRARVIVLHVVNTQAESINAANFKVRQGQQELVPYLDRIRKMARDSGVEIEVVVIGSSKPEKTIVDQARMRQADVILMGRHGKAGRLSRLVGKMTTKVIAQGFPRILVAPKDCPISGTHILLAADGSPNGQRAAQEALSLGRSCTTLKRMTVMSVAEHEGERTRAQELVDAICSRAHSDQLPIACAPLTAVGDPAEIVVKAADELGVDMILLGGLGKGRVAKILKGHVTENVIGRARCAVLVVTAGSQSPV